MPAQAAVGWRALRFIAALCFAVQIASGQDIQLNNNSPLATLPKQHVELETQSVAVKASSSVWVELRFRVAPGLHINSHTPHDELLLPTTLELSADTSKVLEKAYPPGVPLRLEVGQGETLSTYQGEFSVRLRLNPAKGKGRLIGELHYQACDARACFPPKKLPVNVVLTTE